jgi:hypothetical protein
MKSVKRTKNKTDICVEDINENHLIYKSNDLLLSPQRLNLYEHRVLSILASMIKKNDDSFCRHRINIKDFMQKVGVNDKSAYRKIKTITKDLMSKVVTVNTDYGSTIFAQWLIYAEYHDKE